MPLEKNILPIESQDPNADLSEGLKLLEKAFPTWYVDEVNEDIEGFKKVLEQNLATWVVFLVDLCL